METASEVELDAQYRALRESAGVLERSGRRLIEVTGSEAAEYLQGQLTNEVEALETGQGCYAALLDRKGRMQGDMRVLRVSQEALLIDTEAVAGDAVLRHLSMYRVGRDAALADVSAERSVISVIGPAAGEIAGAGPLRGEHANREIELAGGGALAVATDLGVDLIVASAQAGAVRSALLGNGGEPVGADAAEIVRVESGRPRYGAEMGVSTIPQEAGINERAVSFTKGCYIGQETVARLHYKGKPNRHLRGLRLDGPASAGDTVVLGEREVGRIGTSVLSPARGRLALAVLRREAEPGARVAIGDAASAEVVELPF